MWLPSGHPVVVVPESVAARIAKGDVSLSAGGVPDLKLGSKPQSQLPLSSTAPDNGVLLSAPPPIHLAAGGAPPPDSIGTPSLDSQQLRPSQTSESSPPPPEYAPDPAELARRRRGEAQPQWMTLEHLPGYQGQQATPKGGGAHGSAAANAQQSEPLPSGSQPQGQQGSLTTGVTTADSERHVATTDGGERRDAEDVEAPAPPLPPRPLPGQGVLVERSDGEAVEASAPPLPPRPLPGQGVLGPVARKPVPNQSPTGT